MFVYNNKRKEGVYKKKSFILSFAPFISLTLTLTLSIIHHYFNKIFHEFKVLK